MNHFKGLIAGYILLAMASTSSHALGPVDGEIGIALWNNEYQVDLSQGDIDAGSTMIYGETWLGDTWGLRGAWFDSDLDGVGIPNQSRTQLEVRRRLLSASDNNYFALGAGIEQLDLINGQDTSGFRISAEGRAGLPGSIFVYGKFAWTPDLGDAGNFKDISAREVDAGIHITPMPFLSIRLGYLDYEVDFDNATTGRSGASSTSGFYLGTGFHW